MTRTLYPCRDTMRAHMGNTAAKWIAALVFVGAFFLGPDVVISLVTQ